MFWTRICYHVSENSTNSGVSGLPISGSFLSNAESCAISSGVSVKSNNPDQYFDVAIAEQHAVTFAAGLAIGGYKPVVAIYSTFLQRAYDQVIHDVAIQKLPVLFAIDRAGIVGADGQTHQGAFDL